MRVVQRGLPTPPCPGMQTNSSFPCSWRGFDSELAGCAMVLDIPGTREVGENCRVLKGPLEAEGEGGALNCRLQEPLAESGLVSSRPLVGGRGGGKEGGAEGGPGALILQLGNLGGSSKPKQ